MGYAISSRCGKREWSGAENNTFRRRLFVDVCRRRRWQDDSGWVGGSSVHTKRFTRITQGFIQPFVSGGMKLSGDDRVAEGRHESEQRRGLGRGVLSPGLGGVDGPSPGRVNLFQGSSSPLWGGWINPWNHHAMPTLAACSQTRTDGTQPSQTDYVIRKHLHHLPSDKRCMSFYTVLFESSWLVMSRDIVRFINDTSAFCKLYRLKFTRS